MQTALKTQEVETRHDKFLRLMHKRLGRVLDDIRLVTQLSSDNYENSLDEAYEVVSHLNSAVHTVAHSFDVPFTSHVGEQPKSQNKSVLDEVDIVRAIDYIRHDDAENAIALLKSALSGSKT